MENLSIVPSRPDVDIEEDLQAAVRHYAPLQMSRPYFNFRSEGGIVKLSGTVRTPQARRVLVESTGRIDGVRGIDDTDLHDDEEVRTSVGGLLPLGIYATVHGGVVSLTGSLPRDISAESLETAVRAVAGVRRVGVAVSSVAG